MRISAALLAMVLAMMIVRPAAAASPAGKYSDGNLTVDLSDSPGGLTGTLAIGGQQFPATAHPNATGLDGTFKAGADNFPFTATLDGDTMTLISGGKTYTLKRAAHAANPLGDAQPANPLAQAAASFGDAPAGYKVVVVIESGKSLMTVKTSAASVQAALEATIPELGRFFGAKLVIGHAYESAADHKSGGATFTSTLNGQPIKGFINCKLNDNQGANVAVIFCKSDAPKADWDKLLNPTNDAPPAQGNAGNTAPAAGPPSDADVDAKVAAAAKVLGPSAQTYQYPDGTGSIILADGWTTKSQSVMDATFLKGPADQTASINVAIQVQTKDSPLVKMIAQNEEQAKKNEAMYEKMNMKLPPPPPKPFMLVAEFTDPLQAFNDLIPQLNEFNQSKGLPTVHIDQMISHKDATLQIPNSKAAALNYLATRTLDGKSTQYHTMEFNVMIPGLQPSGPWTYMTSSSYSAPVSSFDHDQPIMQAMIHSLKIDKQMLAQRSQERMQQQNQMAQQNMAMMKQNSDNFNRQMQANHDQFMQDQQQRFDIGQEQHQAQEDMYAQHNQQFQQDELAKARNKDDFVETIQGTRTVYDTQTGQAAKVDLLAAPSVVDELNREALDPNRFVQIPLRDEQDPIPAGQ